jgi:hypothetical protein
MLALTGRFVICQSLAGLFAAPPFMYARQSSTTVTPASSAEEVRAFLEGDANFKGLVDTLGNLNGKGLLSLSRKVMNGVYQGQKREGQRAAASVLFEELHPTEVEIDPGTCMPRPFTLFIIFLQILVSHRSLTVCSARVCAH